MAIMAGIIALTRHISAEFGTFDLLSESLSHSLSLLSQRYWPKVGQVEKSARDTLELRTIDQVPAGLSGLHITRV